MPKPRALAPPALRTKGVLPANVVSSTSRVVSWKTYAPTWPLPPRCSTPRSPRAVRDGRSPSSNRAHVIAGEAATVDSVSRSPPGTSERALIDPRSTVPGVPVSSIATIASPWCASGRKPM